MNVGDAVASRRLVRGFLDKPVDLEQLKGLIAKASAAPSGGNIQPWHIHLIVADKLAQFKALMAQRVASEPGGEGSEYDIYPRDMVEPYCARRFEIGAALYARLGIPREDKHARNGSPAIFGSSARR